ncbi:hypothetical protein [Robbsia andropogonis]|uniref:hypothetical protein n=1 Tax=Robbsia andropogonis TaxID=28092 RepID=UPI002A6A77DD|nr:hypothetical protein [Robbsia andropogonis]
MSSESSTLASWTWRAQYGMVTSMRRWANTWDNAPTACFSNTLKVERTLRCRYETRAQARFDVIDWIEELVDCPPIEASNQIRPPYFFAPTTTK